MKRNVTFWPVLALVVLLGACGSDVHDHDDHDDHHGHNHDPNEVMTTLKLTFTPTDGGTKFVATWADPENDGSPVIDEIKLTKGKKYNVTMAVLNELEKPVEDVTPEIKDEQDDHQVFFYGEAVEGPGSKATKALVKHEYSDKDSKNLPVGLSNTIEAVEAGNGSLFVMLRHMPPVNNNAVKTGTLAADFKATGESALPGSADINIDFKLTVE